nr:hypothetical protein CFP56_61374 [Quercus suber]
MVVSRKKSSNRKDKKHDSAPTNITHAVRHEGADERTGPGDAAKVTPGLGVLKTNEGKRKAYGDLVGAAPAHSRGAKTREDIRSNKLLKIIWTPTNAASHFDKYEKFQFLSKSKNGMDDTSEGKDSGNFSNSRVVQLRPEGGIEMDFSTNTGEAADLLKIEKETTLGWESIPILCVAEPRMKLSTRRMLEDQHVASSLMGNCFAMKIIQVI